MKRSRGAAQPETSEALRMPAGGSGRTREWEADNEPAGIRNARRRAGRRPRQTGAIGIPAIPSLGGLTSARRSRKLSEALRMPPPLNQLPWNFAKDQFGAQGADFIGVLGALILRTCEFLQQPSLLEDEVSPSCHLYLALRSATLALSRTTTPETTSLLVPLPHVPTHLAPAIV